MDNNYLSGKHLSSLIGKWHAAKRIRGMAKIIVRPEAQK
jgi:hypothetical protein